MDTKYFEVGGHRFCVTATEQDFALMRSYEPFAVSPDSGEQGHVFALTVTDGEPVGYTEELRQSEDYEEIVCGYADGQAGRMSVFEFRWMQQTAGWLVCSADYREGRLVMTGRRRILAIDNALMVIYALATARLRTALFHASAVRHNGRAYMFLGRSGTGKSTHAGLWQRYISGCSLMNDDNPVVRIADDGTVMVYGSPWSGKTPCYRNVCSPLGGIVLLSQAPHNRIRRLEDLEAYAALVPSISGKRWDSHIADGLHQTENFLASTAAVWHLECLPDEGAAVLCESAVSL